MTMRSFGEADLLGALRRHQRRAGQRLAHHGARVERPVGSGVDVHQIGEQLLIERAPIGADPHRLAVLGGKFDDRGELLVLLFLEADIARIDAVFGERLAAGGMIGEQLVADVMEIADERDVASLLRELLENMRHGRRRLVAIDGDAHQLRALLRQRQNLRDGRLRRPPCRCWSWTGRRPARRRRRSPRRGPRQQPPRRCAGGAPVRRRPGRADGSLMRLRSWGSFRRSLRTPIGRP